MGCLIEIAHQLGMSCASVLDRVDTTTTLHVHVRDASIPIVKHIGIGIAKHDSIGLGIVVSCGQ